MDYWEAKKRLSIELSFSQILECNGVSFENIELAEAVVHLKSGKELDLLILKGSQDLLLGESSGYDSSSGASGSGRPSEKPKPKSKARVAFKTDDVKEELDELRRLAEEKKLLESQMEVERRRLEREQDQLKKESEKLEADKKKFEEEKRKQVIVQYNNKLLILNSDLLTFFSFIILNRSVTFTFYLRDSVFDRF